MHHIFNLNACKRLLKARLLQFLFACIPRFRPNIANQEVGVNLVGYYKGDLGLGEALRYVAKTLHHTSIPFLIRRFSPYLRATQNNQSVNHHLGGYCKYPINCLVINPDMLYRLPTWIHWQEWIRRYNIGYWFWELPTFPKHWRYALSMVDEIWVNTEFNAIAMRKVHPQVVKIPFAIEFELPQEKYNRTYFDLPEDNLLFLSTFDFNSSIERKNPQAVISTFQLAFPDRTTPVQLIIKSINSHAHHLAFTQLQKQAMGDTRIQFIEAHFDSEEMRGLLQTIDCYISLHRSEGLGLTMAEAMYLGKPVVATNYSGNTEFMDQETACLIPCKQIPVPTDAYTQSENQVWAEPDISAAAQVLRELASNQNLRAAIGYRARAYMLEHHSFKVMGTAIAQRIEQIKTCSSAATH